MLLFRRGIQFIPDLAWSRSRGLLGFISCALNHGRPRGYHPGSYGSTGAKQTYLAHGGYQKLLYFWEAMWYALQGRRVRPAILDFQGSLRLSNINTRMEIFGGAGDIVCLTLSWSRSNLRALPYIGNHGSTGPHHVYLTYRISQRIPNHWEVLWLAQRGCLRARYSPKYPRALQYFEARSWSQPSPPPLLLHTS